MKEHVKFIGPYATHDTGRTPCTDGAAIAVVESQHTPWNKRHGEVQSHATLNVENGDDWVTIRMTENTTSRANGNSQSRTISMTLPRAVAEQLCQHVSHSGRRRQFSHD